MDSWTTLRKEVFDIFIYMPIKGVYYLGGVVCFTDLPLMGSIIFLKWKKVWLYPSSLSVWSQIVLAKNLPKGEFVGYLYVGITFAKINIHVRCWIQCSNMWVWFSVPWFCVLYHFLGCFIFVWDHWIFFEDLIHVDCSPRSLFLEARKGGLYLA